MQELHRAQPLEQVSGCLFVNFCPFKTCICVILNPSWREYCGTSDAVDIMRKNVSLHCEIFSDTILQERGVFFTGHIPQVTSTGHHIFNS